MIKENQRHNFVTIIFANFTKTIHPCPDSAFYDKKQI